MNPFVIVGVGALLLALFLVIAAAMIWQEARKRGYEESAPYVVEDAVGYTWERLAGEVRSRLTRRDVQRILEWEIYYLQGMADRKAKGVDIVAGSDQGVSFIQARTAAVHQAEYSAEDIRAVLALEAEYLASIGAVGERIGEIAG